MLGTSHDPTGAEHAAMRSLRRPYRRTRTCLVMVLLIRFVVNQCSCVIHGA